MDPCMGGWCTRRSHCAHYHAPSLRVQDGRLCRPGQADNYVPLVQPQAAASYTTAPAVAPPPAPTTQPAPEAITQEPNVQLKPEPATTKPRRSRAKRRREADRRPKALQLLETAGPAGMTLQQLAQATNSTENAVRQALRRLQAEQRAHRQWRGGRSPALYYAAGVVPAGPPPLALPTRGQDGRTVSAKSGSKALTLDASQPAIVPPGVVVQVCVAGRDQRFSADPSIAGRGVISADWRARVQGGAA